MPKCNLLSHGKTLPQNSTLRRSPRFLPQENAQKIHNSNRSKPRKNKVRITHIFPPIISLDTTETISLLKSKQTRKSVRLESLKIGSRELARSNNPAAGNFRVLRRSPRFSNLQSTPENADKKTRFEDSVLSGCTRKKGWDGKKEQRFSLRLMCLAKGVKDSSGVLGELNSSEVARKGGGGKEPSLLKGGYDSCDVSRKLGFSDVTQKGDRRKKQNSVRLIDSERSVDSSIDFLEKRVSSEVTQKRDCRKDRRSSHMLTGSAKGFKELSDFSEKGVSVESSEKGNCQKERRRSVRLMASANGEEKSEMGANRYEESGRKMEREMIKANSVNPTVVVPMEGGRKRRKIESGDIGVIEKRSEPSMEGCDFQGWTKDQEAALHRAYLVAKPSPHFWKKVSKMVPGKSAQECFDKVHSSHETPPPQSRLRTNKMNSFPLGNFKLSSGKLLETFKPNGKKTRNSKQKNLLAQKTVRHLLQKHLLVDQGYEADLFSVLETTTDLPTHALSQTKMPVTPDCVLKPHCNERSSLTATMIKSKFETQCHTDLTSPPVLKRVKNMALHEKYIDQLHSREARRKRTTNYDTADNVTMDIGVKEMDIKSAKSALVSDAKDVIMQFQHMQSIGMSDYKDFGDDDDDNDGDDECEEGPY